MRACLSVCLSVGPSVRPSIGPSVYLAVSICCRRGLRRRSHSETLLCSAETDEPTDGAAERRTDRQEAALLTPEGKVPAYDGFKQPIA